MTPPIRTSRGVGRYVASEVDLVLGTRLTFTGDAPPLIYCHGSGDTADSTQNKTGQRPLLRELAEHFTVGVADLGLEPWGNDTHIARVGQERTYLGSSWGASEPAVIVAVSMGALGALAYARTDLANVAGIALIIPALDIADIYAATAGGPWPVQTLIDTAYGGTYNDETHGPTHSPVQFADELDGIPIGIWAADNDSAARPGPVNAFVTARPETDLTWVGNLEHTEAAITAAHASLVDWVLSI